MPYEHQGMKLWVKPDRHLASGTMEQGSDVHLTVGVEPADASNRVQVKYRVNGGPATVIDAEPLRHVGSTQFFTAKLPCATLCDGDTLEYSAACQCAGRQVSSTHEAEQFSWSLRVMNGKVTEAQTAMSNTMSVESAPVKILPLSVGTPTKTALSNINYLKPTHLSLFVLERTTGHPIAGMPCYAEVGVVSLSRPPKPACKLEDVIRQLVSSSALEEVVWQLISYSAAVKILPGPQYALGELLCDALSRFLAQETIDRMAGDLAYAAPIISAILQIAQGIALGKNIDANDPEALPNLLEDAIRAYAKEHDLPLAGINTQEQRIVWAHPLGVLATDHVGYLSFDLTRLPPDVAEAVALALEARRRDPNAVTDTSIWIYPMAREESRIDALAQMRFAHDAIVVKLELDLELDPILCQPKLCDSIKNLGIMAMQNPSLTDWRLSPGSFATSPGALVGADGCEMVLPSNIALHEFNFHQVIGVPAAEVALPIDATAASKVRPGFVNEFRLSFIPIGHALGQILYSFPLAPGESVNFAVIDWTRRDSALRNETTKLDESLVHELRRDRIITETVQASIDEWQHGGSLMGGLATSAGGAIGGSGMGGAVGASNAIGGAYSTTSGSRDIAADTVQKLSDNVAQAATSARELHSTVVVQSAQAEHEAIETRTVVNYNHSHALTILYYEVLRHFRVVTEFVRRRPALLTNIHGGIAYVVTDLGQAPRHEIWWPTIYENRKLLEAALLDDRYKESFDIVERRRHHGFVNVALGLARDHKDKPQEQPKPPYGPQLRFFVFDMNTGGWNSDANDRNIQVEATLWPKNIKLVARDNKVRLNPQGTFQISEQNNSFVGMVPDGNTVYWDDIDLIQIWVHLHNRDVSFKHITVTAIDTNGNKHGLIDKGYEDGHLTLNNDWNIDLPTFRPPSPPQPPGRSAESIEEEAKFLEFNEHLLNHRPHYERALRLGSTPAQRAFELANLRVSGDASLLEKVDNRPLEVLGDYVAYPCIDPVWSEKIMDVINNQVPPIEPVEPVERLITLPTRGVFAEAKLGHCNASEEIDNTRFWDWQQSPIPHLAPDIEAIKAGQHLVKDLNLQSTPFPQSMLNIVNPPSAPDPQGMTAALTALATANIFRDMSGRAEVADLLKKLSDNSVAIAGIAQKAATGGAGSSSGGTGGGVTEPPAAEVGTGTGQSSAPPAASGQNELPAPPQQTPEQREKQHLENQDKKGEIANKYLPPAQNKEVKQAIANDLKKPSVKKRTFEISLKGYANQTIVGQWAWELCQYDQSRGYDLMNKHPNGKIKIELNDEFDDNRFRLNVDGEVLSGYGVNAQIRGDNLDLVIPPDLYKTKNYYYVTLNATTGTFKTKASSSDEVTKKFTEEYKLTPELGYKDIIKVTGEGGWTWEKEGKKSAGREMEMEVTFYAGGFTVGAIN